MQMPVRSEARIVRAAREAARGVLRMLIHFFVKIMLSLLCRAMTPPTPPLCVGLDIFLLPRSIILSPPASSSAVRAAFLSLFTAAGVNIKSQGEARRKVRGVDSGKGIVRLLREPGRSISQRPIPPSRPPAKKVCLRLSERCNL